jgi:hypothetical protein
MFYITEFVVKLLINVFNFIFYLIGRLLWKLKSYPRVIVDRVEFEYLKYLMKEEDDFQAIDKAMSLLIERTKH